MMATINYCNLLFAQVGIFKSLINFSIIKPTILMRTIRIFEMLEFIVIKVKFQTQTKSFVFKNNIQVVVRSSKRKYIFSDL